MPYNLSPAQLSAFSAQYFPEPPASLSQPQFDEPTLQAARAGFLGPTGRLISEFDKQRALLNQQELANQAQQEIAQINPLDPAYYEKVSQIQSRYGPAFITPPVQQALRTGMYQRREAEAATEKQMEKLQEEREASISAGIRKASQTDLENLVEADPMTAMRLAPQIASREAKLAEADMLSSQVPQHLLQGVDKTNPLAIKKAAQQFKASLPPVLQRIDDLATLNDIVGLAEQWTALRDKTKNPDYEATPEDDAAMSTLFNSINTMLPRAVDDPSSLLVAKDKIISPVQKYKKEIHPEAKRLLESLR